MLRVFACGRSIMCSLTLFYIVCFMSLMFRPILKSTILCYKINKLTYYVTTVQKH